MNGIKRSIGFLVKLGITAGVLLFTQQALAAGTVAGTDIDNLAVVDYVVNGVNQTDIESSPTGNSTPGAGNGVVTTFVVDNRVDFTLLQVGSANTTVNPDQLNAFVAFTLTNTGNSPQDFRMTVAQLALNEAANGELDSGVDMNNLRIRVANGGGAPVLGDLDYADELAPDASVTVYVFADADTIPALVDGDIANLELTATVAEAGVGSTLGADLVDDFGNADDPNAVDIVFADGGALGDGIESDRDGFTVQSAGLTVMKTATLISDPFNGTTNPKAIPGAIIEYVITVTNAGTLTAEDVVIADMLSTDVSLNVDEYGADIDVDIDNNGAPVTPCNADNLDTDGDGCALTGPDLTVGNTTTMVLDVAPATTLTITFRVTIL